VLFHRVCFNCAFSPQMAPAGHASLGVEITTNPGDGVYELSDEALCERVREELVRVGVLRPDDKVVERVVQREFYAYVVYDRAYTDNVRIVKDYFKTTEIYAAGRFAEHTYINMDAVIRRTLDLSRELDETSAPMAR